MKVLKIIGIFLIIQALTVPTNQTYATSPTGSNEEWTYLLEQGVLLESESERNWKSPITRMDAVIYLARALKLEKPLDRLPDDTSETIYEDDTSEEETDTSEEATQSSNTDSTETIVSNELSPQQLQQPVEQNDVHETVETIPPLVSIFSDVSSDDENYWMILEFHKRGIISGFSDGTFRPNNQLTRGDMARIIAGSFQLSGTSSIVFSDLSPKAPYYTAVQSLVATSITAGYPDFTYRPHLATTHEHMLLFVARTMEPSFRKSITVPPPPPPEPKACEVKVAKPKTKIAVQAANFWKTPNQSRIIDAPASTNPTDLRRWSASLTENQSWWLVKQTDTQALYGDTVSTIQTSGNWVKVATKDQWVPYNAAGYPGWVPASQIVNSYYDYSDCRIAIVHAKTAWLLDAATNKKTVEISYSTILPVVGEEKDRWVVAAPNDKKMYVAKTDVKVHKNYASVPKPTATTVINEAKRFLGLRYIWSGTSAYGFDCSGILYAVMRTHGVLIPRDSFYQATKGTWVSKSNLRAGDFIFFAGNSGTGKVYHVGLYLGEGMMLHAPNASSSVRIERYDNGAYKKNYYVARRYIK